MERGRGGSSRRRACQKCACPLMCLAGERRRVCVRCQEMADRAYYQTHRTERLQDSHARYQRIRALRLDQAALYYRENREVILAKKRVRDALAAGLGERARDD